MRSYSQIFWELLGEMPIDFHFDEWSWGFFSGAGGRAQSNFLQWEDEIYAYDAR